jgi:hypothetical protein
MHSTATKHARHGSDVKRHPHRSVGFNNLYIEEPLSNSKTKQTIFHRMTTPTFNTNSAHEAQLKSIGKKLQNPLTAVVIGYHRSETEKFTKGGE